MLLLITKYNLSPRWLQLITFLIFYFILIKLHYLDFDNNIIECMHKKAKSEPLSTEELERKYPSAAIMHKHFSVPTKPSTEVLADFTAAPKNTRLNSSH